MTAYELKNIPIFNEKESITDVFYWVLVKMKLLIF